MADVTQILNAIGQGDPHAAVGLLALVYDDLRKLAAAPFFGRRPPPPGVCSAPWPT